jgi:hypothetical protein
VLLSPSRAKSVFFIFLNDWKKSKEYFMICEKYIKFTFQCQQIFLFLLLVLYDTFLTTMKKMSNCHRLYGPQHLKDMALYRKGVPTPSYIKKNYSQEWWRMPVIPALGRLRQKDHKLEASLCYTVRPALKKKCSKLS